MAGGKQTRPYRSVHAGRRGAYHDRTDCPIGRLIHSDELRTGTGHNSLCKECRALHEQSALASQGRGTE
jgi:hypothetical protein